MTGSSAARLTGRRTLLVLLLVFCLPLLLAFWVYYGSAWRPSGRTNHGELIEPPRQLPPLASAAAHAAAAGAALQGHWSLVYVGDGACDAACREVLQVMRRTHAALGRLTPRVQQVLLAGPGCCDRVFLEHEHPGLQVIDASGAGAAGLLAAFGRDGHARTVFIVDPLGNLMMRYDIRLGPRGLLQDLKKLLELSHIG